MEMILTIKCNRHIFLYEIKQEFTDFIRIKSNNNSIRVVNQWNHRAKLSDINYPIIFVLFIVLQAFYFNRDDVALPGLSSYFKKSSDEEREHAMKLMAYQNKRGGNIMLQNINAPEKTNWGTANETMRAALALEKDVNEVHEAGAAKDLTNETLFIFRFWLYTEFAEASRLGLD